MMLDIKSEQKWPLTATKCFLSQTGSSSQGSFHFYTLRPKGAFFCTLKSDWQTLPVWYNVFIVSSSRKSDKRWPFPEAGEGIRYWRWLSLPAARLNPRNAVMGTWSCLGPPKRVGVSFFAWAPILQKEMWNIHEKPQSIPAQKRYSFLRQTIRPRCPLAW